MMTAVRSKTLMTMLKVVASTMMGMMTMQSFFDYFWTMCLKDNGEVMKLCLHSLLLLKADVPSIFCPIKLQQIKFVKAASSCMYRSLYFSLQTYVNKLFDL